jgi:purine-nucleoside phosphorylase
MKMSKKIYRVETLVGQEWVAILQTSDAKQAHDLMLEKTSKNERVRSFCELSE